MERENEANLMVSARVNVRDLAVIVKVWQQQLGRVPRSTSTLIREALRALAQSYVREQPELACASIEEALQEVVGADLTFRSDRSRRLMARALKEEALQEEAKSGYGVGQRWEVPAQPTKPIGEREEELDRIERICQHLRKIGKSEQEIATTRDSAIATMDERLAQSRARRIADAQALLVQQRELAKLPQPRAQAPEAPIPEPLPAITEAG